MSEDILIGYLYPIKVIIINISKTIKDKIKISTAHWTWAQGACTTLYLRFFWRFLNWLIGQLK